MCVVATRARRERLVLSHRGTSPFVRADAGRELPNRIALSRSPLQGDDTITHEAIRGFESDQATVGICPLPVTGAVVHAKHSLLLHRLQYGLFHLCVSW